MVTTGASVAAFPDGRIDSGGLDPAGSHRPSPDSGLQILDLKFDAKESRQPHDTHRAQASWLARLASI